MKREHGTDPELSPIAARLEAERPVLRPAFRGELRRRLLAEEKRRLAPANLGRLIAAYTGSGAILIAIAVAGVAGLGPFAA
jgi:hypothetical protein